MKRIDVIRFLFDALKNICLSLMDSYAKEVRDISYNKEKFLEFLSDPKNLHPPSKTFGNPPINAYRFNKLHRLYKTMHLVQEKTIELADLYYGCDTINALHDTGWDEAATAMKISCEIIPILQDYWKG